MSLFINVFLGTPDDLAVASRTPSPPHLNETHEELLDHDFVEEDPHNEDTSVVAGGYIEGWSPVAAVVPWRRIHGKVFECLTSVWTLLAKVIQ